MKKFFSRAFCSIMALALLLCNITTVAYAKEPSLHVNANESNTSAQSVLYLNDWADFNYGTDMRPLISTMTSGRYTLHYSVTKPTTLILWHDSFTQYSFNLSGDGQRTINVSYACYSWQCISQYSDVSVSFVIEK